MNRTTSALLLCLVMAVQRTAAQTSDPRDDASPWGMSSSSEWFSAYPQFNPLLKDAGVRWLRYFPGWFSIEPKQGEFNWTSADKLMANARENKLHVSGLFVFFPPWAAADGKNPRACPVKDIAFWSEYVRQSVTRYKDDIKYWEIWNEFNGGGFAISKDKPKDYADMTVAAYDAAKAVDPTTMIGMSCANFDLNFFDKAIKAGAADHFDFLAVHPYENMGEATKEGGEPVFLSMAGSLRKMLADNKQNVNMPLWITEVGYQAPVKPDAVKDALQADAIVKCYIMAIAQGFSKIEWFEARGPQYGKGTDHGIIRADWTLRPSYDALKRMIALLGAEPKYVGWVKPGGEDYGFVFKGKDAYVMATWAARHAGMDITFKGDVRLMDQTGKPRTLQAGTAAHVDRTALFVLDLPADLVQEAVANKNKPFPWGGDFTEKETVRCLLGSNAENGLSLTTPESLTVVNALDHTYATTLNDKGKIPHHFSFRVHPSFVSDSPREFEITMVAKRADPAKQAQTKIFFYESANGYKPTGAPWVIPEGDTWLEHSWRVTDANFVGQWGYNICFEVQSVNPFLVKEVRVKRLNGMNPGETVADATVPQNNAMSPVKDVPNLPRVLLIGDSISIAYTLPVRALLKDKANVHRIPVNGSASGSGVAGVKSWIGTSQWDVIVFNFGIHDSKLYDDAGKVAQSREGAHPATSLEKYESNLREIIRQLQPTGTRLIFATTTPIPEVTTGRLFDSIPARNQLAMKVMKECGVDVCDLYSVMLPRQKEFLRPGDVHFTPAGSALLADAVAASIEAHLSTPPKSSPHRKSQSGNEP